MDEERQGPTLLYQVHDDVLTDPSDVQGVFDNLPPQTGARTKELMVRLGYARPKAAMLYQHAASDRDQRIETGLDARAVDAGLDFACDYAQSPESPSGCRVCAD